MHLHQKSYTATASPFVINLRTLPDLGIQGLESASAGLIFERADYDIEVVGNDSIVTVTAKGPFPSSDEKAVTDGTFAATTGGKKTVSNIALGSLTFTFPGTAGFTINLIRWID